MRLVALELERFRKFDRPVRLDGFGPGINLLCGPNEFGKSTILAAIRALLFERYASKAETIRRMQSRGGNAAPRLAMEFDLGAGAWRLEKRFMQQPMAMLTAPDGARFDGDAAEEKLQSLLGFGAAGSKGAKTETMGMWGALWVTQRQSVEQPDVSGEQARATLIGCLDAEVGTLTGSGKGGAILKAAREQLATLQDGNGKPKGRARQVIEELAALQAARVALEDRARQLADDAEALRQKTRAFDQEARPEVAADLTDKLTAARQAQQAMRVHASELEAKRLAAETAARAWRDAEAELAAREARLATRRTLAQESVTASAAQRVALDEERVATREADAAREALRLAAERAAASATALRDLRRLEGAARAARRLGEAQAVLDRARALSAEVSRLSAELAGLKVTRDAAGRLEEAEREAAGLRHRLEAQAPVLEWALAPDGAARLRVNGAPVGADTGDMPVTETAVLTIEGVGTIRVRPAAGDAAALRAKLATAETRRREAMAETGCADAAAARAAAAAREAVERALSAAAADLQRVTAGDRAAGLAPGLPALEAQVATLRQEAERAAEASDIEARLLAAEAEELAAREARDAASAAERRHAEAAQAARTARLLTQNDLTTRIAAIARLDAEANEAEAREPEADLRRRVAEAAAAATRAAEAHAMHAASRPEETEADLQARVQRLTQALENRNARLTALREEIARLREAIKQAGGEGLDEQIAEAGRRIEALTLERDQNERETRLLRLLLETLTRAEGAAKERYLAPVTRRVTPYLQRLFPGAAITCDEHFRVVGMARGGRDAEAFDRLSDGTQEQIAVLTRLAFADMLLDQGKPAMVVLDDALVFADLERMERMFDILFDAGQRMQMLIMTCRADLFARLGGTRLALTESA